MITYSIDELFDGIRAGNRRLLAKAISLIESEREADRVIAQDLLTKVLPFTGKSQRIGITGAPGVGKSTFIESFGLHVISKGHTVAVLTIDPSSARSGGSILGDKTRMHELSQNSKAYIRPSPSHGTLGGVAHATREVMLLCEAAGFDVVIIETVGVGQSETEVASMVDLFMALMLPNAGDELQGIKRGIMEMGDIFVITKADGEQVNQAQLAFQQMRAVLRLLRPKSSHWSPKVFAVSALESKGISDVWECCDTFFTESEKHGVLATQRAAQNKHWLHSLLENRLRQRFFEFPPVADQLSTVEQAVIKGEILPTLAAEKLLELLPFISINTTR
ncbi:MAG: methylmalonyl Co-A mutase-associated GTPase MeaB [Ignavibacteria bacterium]|nr:methylmalonyl Co-A mutase-associated GTPase MeaB [Ignavibacteria bacterium]